jgi:hypothetical protein
VSHDEIQALHARLSELEQSNRAVLRALIGADNVQAIVESKEQGGLIGEWRTMNARFQRHLDHHEALTERTSVAREWVVRGVLMIGSGAAVAAFSQWLGG